MFLGSFSCESEKFILSVGPRICPGQLELQHQECDEAPEGREPAQDAGEHVEHEERRAVHVVERAVDVEDDGKVGGVVAHADGVRAVRVEGEVAAGVRPLQALLVPEHAVAAAAGLGW